MRAVACPEPAIFRAGAARARALLRWAFMQPEARPERPSERPNDEPTIEVAEIDPSELGSLAPYHLQYRSLGFGEASMVMLASVLVIPLAKPEPPPRDRVGRALVIAMAIVALMAGGGCVAFTWTAFAP
jgi:hypothetical protein